MPDNTWVGVVLTILGVGGGGGIIYLIKAPSDMRKTNAETGLTNTEAATQLADSWAKLVTAVESQAASYLARAVAAEAALADCERRTTDAQRAVTVMEGRMNSMREQIVSLELELAERVSDQHASDDRPTTTTE